MDGIELLIAEARDKRDQTMSEARHQYMMAIREIRAVDRKLRSAEGGGAVEVALLGYR